MLQSRKEPAIPPDRPAIPRLIGRAALLGFAVWVLVPAAVAGIYLARFAADQYVSRLGFTVRREEAPLVTNVLGGLAQLSGSASSDSDILFQYIQSQELVAEVDRRVNLRQVYEHPSDPFFALRAEATIEDLVAYWRRMVRLYHDPAAGLIEVEVRAFDPVQARAVASELLTVSSEMINRLADIARADTTRQAREEFDAAAARLRSARQALTLFRDHNRIIDISADLSGQMGVLGSLQEQLAEAMIAYDMLGKTAQEGDPRLHQARARIEVIEARIEGERGNLGGGGAGGRAFADLVGEYEGLRVDLEFAEAAYLSARSGLDAVLSEARRQNRYLAAFVRPTLAEASHHPDRLGIWILLTLGLAGTWGIAVLTAAALRDRR